MCKCITRERQKDGTYKASPCACEAQRQSGTPISDEELQRELAKLARIGREIEEYGTPAAKPGTVQVLVSKRAAVTP